MGKNKWTKWLGMVLSAMMLVSLLPAVGAGAEGDNHVLVMTDKAMRTFTPASSGTISLRYKQRVTGTGDLTVRMINPAGNAYDMVYAGSNQTYFTGGASAVAYTRDAWMTVEVTANLDAGTFAYTVDGTELFNNATLMQTTDLQALQFHVPSGMTVYLDDFSVQSGEAAKETDTFESDTVDPWGIIDAGCTPPTLAVDNTVPADDTQEPEPPEEGNHVLKATAQVAKEVTLPETGNVTFTWWQKIIPNGQTVNVKIGTPTGATVMDSVYTAADPYTVYYSGTSADGSGVYAPGEWQKIKLELDMTGGTFTATIADGTPVHSNLDNKATLAAFLLIPTAGAEIYIDDFTVHTDGGDPVVSSYEDGQIDFGGASLVVDDTVPSDEPDEPEPEQGNHVLSLTSNASYQFGNGVSAGKVVIGYKQRINAASGMVNVRVISPTGMAFDSEFKPNGVCGFTGNNGNNFELAYTNDTWMAVKIEMDLDAGTYSVSFDGVEQFAGGTLTNTDNLMAWQFFVADGATVAIDDISVRVGSDPRITNDYESGNIEFANIGTAEPAITVDDTVPAGDVDPDEPVVAEPGIYDDFETGLPAGWTEDANVTREVIQYPPNHVLKITGDTGRVFDAVSDGVLTLRFRQKFESIAGTCNMRVITPAGQVFDSAYTADGTTGTATFTNGDPAGATASFTLGKWTDVEIRIDLTNRRYTVAYDGVTKVTAPVENTEGTQQWQFVVPAGSVLCLDDIEILHNGSILTVAEYFEKETIDSLWTNTGTIARTEEVEQANGYAKFTSSGDSSNRVTRNYASTGGKMSIAFQFMGKYASASQSSLIQPYGFLKTEGVQAVFDLTIAGNGNVSLAGSTARANFDEWNTFRVEIDCDAAGNTPYTAYLNGTQFASGTSAYSFKEIANIVFGVPKDAVLYLDDLTVTDGAGSKTLESTFDTAADLTDWVCEDNVAKEHQTTAAADNHCLSITGSGAAQGQIYRTFFDNKVENVAKVSAKVRFDSINSTFTLQAMDSAVANAIDFVVDGSGMLYATGAEGARCKLAFGKWYEFDFLFNFLSHTYSLSVDGERVVSDAAFGGTMNDLAVFNFSSIQPGTRMLLDDLSVAPAEEGELYVRSLTIQDAEGVRVTRLAGKTGVKFTADIANDTFASKDVAILLAYYVDDALQTVTVTEDSIPAGGKTVQSAVMAIDTAGLAEGQLNVQAFVLDSLTSLHPLSDKFSVKGDEEVWVAPMPWYNVGDYDGEITQQVLRPDFNAQFGSRANWDSVYAQTDVVKSYINILNDEHWGTDLPALVEAVGDKEMAFEVGGVQMMPYKQYGDQAGEEAAEFEWDVLLKNWVDAGGTLDYITTDHAITHSLNAAGEDALEFSDEVYRAIIDEQMDYFAAIHEISPNTRFGMIESLGYFDVTEPGGTKYAQTADVQPSGNKEFAHFMEMVMESAREHGVTIDHFDVDFSYMGVVWDAGNSGDTDGDGMNFGRIMEVERICRDYGVKVGIIFNDIVDNPQQVHDNIIKYYEGYKAAVGTPDKAVFQSWWMYPRVTGPEETQGTFFNWTKELLDIK